jgi:ADP-ribose pyrophosphatase YjhB (NUDIX family)
VSVSSSILARGPWEFEQLEVVWHDEPFEPHPGQTAAADVALGELRERGSPSHDGLAARLADFQERDGALCLELQPARWALRLIPEGAAGSQSALCIVRSAAGGWLAGRRAQWLATWAGRWALGAGGSVEVGENPADTLGRELGEEWSVQAQRLRLEALVRLPSGAVLLVGQAWLAPGAEVVPDDEHDAFDWWPADVEDWPEHADEPLRRIGLLLGDR